jgi:hypothetical protein
MTEVLRYRGRVVSETDVAFIRELIASAPKASRRKLSSELCKAWDWRQTNGRLRDMVCRGLMLTLDRGGHIQLPPVRFVPSNPLLGREKPARVEVDEAPVCSSLRELGPLELRQVRRTDEEKLCCGLIEMHHYLGYTQPVGEHLKYLVYAQGRPIACFTWSSAPRHLKPRDRYIGWSLAAQRQNLQLVAYNSRFLILPWVKVPHLASHLLGRMARTLSADWQRVYGHPVYFAETFVDPERNRGTCYLAANWIVLGITTGRGKDAPTWEQNRSKKQVLGAVETLAWLTSELEAKRVSIERLRKLVFGVKTEKFGSVFGDSADEKDGTAAQPAIDQAGNEPGGSDPSQTPANDGSGEGDPAGAAGTSQQKQKRKGHGRNGAQSYPGAEKVHLSHESLKPGDSCPRPDCKGKVYPMAVPALLVRVRGQAPLAATLHSLERMRCNLCGEIFTAQAPPEVGADKYDATAGAMISLLKYGTGVPFYRLQRLQAGFGIPLPAATQWDIVRGKARSAEPVYRELISEAAQGKLVHNDDTVGRVLALMPKRSDQDAATGAEQDPDERTGVFTTGIVAINQQGNQIALFFTGRRHAGENLALVLANRAAELKAPLQMCDGLSRNLPKKLKTILGNCLSHARRRYVDVAKNFRAKCRHVLEALREVYRNDEIAARQNMSAEQRLQWHKTQSGPVMNDLRAWLKAQLDEKQVEPNSGLGEAITYMLKRWHKLTLFLRIAGAPLDNDCYAYCTSCPGSRASWAGATGCALLS